MRDYQDYKTALRIDKLNLDEELVSLAHDMSDLSEHVVALGRNVVEAKEALEMRAAVVKENTKANDAKATVVQLEAAVIGDKSCRDLRRALNGDIGEHERWKFLLECWRAKGEAIRTLAKLHGDNYWSPTSTSTRGGHQEGARAAIRQASQSRDSKAADRAQASIEEACVKPRQPTRTVAQMQERRRRVE